MSVESTLEVILNTVAFKEDESGINISILGKAKDDLSDFLSEHTAISDDEKAKRISDFFTNTIMSVTTQAIMVAGQSPLQDAQIISAGKDDTNKHNESVQKVVSMKNEDKARLNNSAVQVSKAKIEIESLIPAQIQQMAEDINLKKAQTKLEEARIPLLSAQVDNERQQLGLTRQQIRVSATEVQYKLAQLKAIQKASEINQKIEEQKNITSIKIAKIHAS